MNVFSKEWMAYLDLFDFYDFGDMPSSPQKCCLIIEPRNHPYLLKLMKQFMFFLASKGWGLIFCHGNLNEHVGDTIPYLQKMALGIDNLTIAQYNQYMCDPSLWKRLIDMGVEIKYLYSEDSSDYVYSVLISELDNFLLEFGLIRVETVWAHAFYIRKD